jgi:hypothetical protein
MECPEENVLLCVAALEREQVELLEEADISNPAPALAGAPVCEFMIVRNSANPPKRGVSMGCFENTHSIKLKTAVIDDTLTLC